MKKAKLLTAVLILLFHAFTASADITEDIEKLAENFSLEFRDNNPDLVFKPNIGIIPFENESPDAEKYRIGEAVSNIVENSFSRSLIFSLIDEKQREKVIKEIKFSLSGMSETERIEPGKLEGIDYFIYGSVTQLGDNFVISMKAVEVNTSKIIFSQDLSVPRYNIIDYTEKLAAAYVSPYGIGIEFHQTMFYRLNSEMSDIEGQIVEGWPMGFTLNYRISRNLVAWFGFEATAGMFRLADTFEDKTYQKADVKNMDTADPYPDAIMYHKERSYVAGIFGLGYVFNLSRNFNITVGGDVKLGMSYLHQFYTIPDPDPATNVDVEHEVVSNDITLLIVSPVIKFQYYITPRVAINAGYSYGYQVQKPEDIAYFYASTNAQKFPQLYSLDPDIGPDGKPHLIDLTGHRVIFGFGFYF